MRNTVLNILRTKATHLQTQIKAVKISKGYYWHGATPDTEKGREYFEEYSYYREVLKRDRRLLAKTNAAIRAIKRGEVLK